MSHSLISYGAVTNSFKTIAKYKKILHNVKNGKLVPYRLDCYNLETFPELNDKLKSILIKYKEPFIELFYPSDNYPPHVDEGGESFFIPLESGIFYYDGINYSIVPFVLYCFDDGVLHNSNFGSIMIKI